MSQIMNTFARLRTALPGSSAQSRSSEEAKDNSYDSSVEKTSVDAVPLPTTGRGGEGEAKQEQIIRDNLSRFARLPVASVFESVTLRFSFAEITSGFFLVQPPGSFRSVGSDQRSSCHLAQAAWSQSSRNGPSAVLDLPIRTRCSQSVQFPSYHFGGHQHCDRGSRYV
jgi:hypothetical protein